MSLRERIANWIAPGRVNNWTNADSSAFGMLVDQVNPAPMPTEATALTVSAIYAAVNLLSGAIAALPKQIHHRERDGDLILKTDDPLWWVLNEEMTPRWSAANGWEFLILSLLLHGDGFGKILRRPDGSPLGMVPVHPNRVQVLTNEAGTRLVYVIQPDPTLPAFAAKQREVLDQDDVLHIAGFGFDGLRGLSPLKYALRMAGSVALSTQTYSASFFANNARPDYVLQSDQQIGKEKAEELYAQLDNRHKGVLNAHRPMVLGNGLKIEAISMPLIEMELLAQRRFQIEEIARIYGVPAFMIGHTEKTTSWGSGIESMGTGFVRYALRQHLSKIETEVNRKFFRTASRVMKFDTTELERADTKALFESLRIGIGRAGEKQVLTLNEARSKLHLAKVNGGDDLDPGNPDQQTTDPDTKPEPAKDTTNA